MSHFLLKALFACALCALVKLLQRRLSKNPLSSVPGPAAHSFVTGDIRPLFDRCEGWKFTQMLRESYGSVTRLRGLFGADILYISDPSALQHIFSKDGTFYGPPRWVYASNNMVFGPGLIAVHGQRHKRQRKILNPVFSTDNIRQLTPTFYHLGHKLERAIRTLVSEQPKEIDVHHWLSRAALEYVAQGGMGHSFDPLLPGKTATNRVGEAISELVPVLFALQFWRMLSGYLERLGSSALRRKLADLIIALLPDKNLEHLRNIIDTLDASSQVILEQRKAAIKDRDEVILQQVGEGKDMMSALLRANMQANNDDNLSEAELLGQMSTILLAGTDTTTNALGRILHQLAQHKSIQEQLRKELTEAKELYGEDIPYDELCSLPLLDAVCRETLRLYAPIDFIPRETIEDVIMPLRYPIRSANGALLHQITVPRGTMLLPSCRGCNLSKDTWGDDALEWNPARWLAPLPSSVSAARVPGVYSNLMTFSAGTRSCIGFKFSQLEMKVVIAVLLGSFKFSLPRSEIVWNFSGISYPTMSKESMTPSMSLNVEALPLQ